MTMQDGLEGMRDEGGGGDAHGGEMSDLVVALNALARGQEHLDVRNGQILSRLDAVTLIQQQLIERVFDRIDALPLPPDSRDDLIAMRDEVRRQGKAVDALQALPMHRVDMPEALAKGLTAAVQGQVRPAVRAMEAMPSEVRRGVADIDRIVRGNRARRQQNRWLSVVAGAALLAGFGLYPLIAATVPGGSHMAALAAGEQNRWQGGWALLMAYDARARDALEVMQQLYINNTAALRACSNAIWAKGQPQPCSLTMHKPLP